MADKRLCIYCGKAAEHPALPLCVKCDLERLAKGISAQEVKAQETQNDEEEREAIRQKLGMRLRK